MTRFFVLRARLRTMRTEYAYARACGRSPARAIAFARLNRDAWLFSHL